MKSLLAWPLNVVSTFCICTLSFHITYEWSKWLIDTLPKSIWLRWNLPIAAIYDEIEQGKLCLPKSGLATILNISYISMNRHWSVLIDMAMIIYSRLCKEALYVTVSNIYHKAKLPPKYQLRPKKVIYTSIFKLYSISTLKFSINNNSVTLAWKDKIPCGMWLRWLSALATSLLTRISIFWPLLHTPKVPFYWFPSLPGVAFSRRLGPLKVILRWFLSWSCN